MTKRGTPADAAPEDAPAAPQGSGDAPVEPSGLTPEALAEALGVVPAADWDNPLRDPRDRRLPRIAGPSGLVIFGVTGDLSRKKLMPAVYDLANRGLLPPGFSLLGFARREWEDQDFAQVVHDSVREHARTEFREEVWQQLAEGMRFIPGDFDDDNAFEQLREAVEELDSSQGTSGNYAFYLSVPPKFFPKVVQQLKKHGLADAPEGSWRRAVIEKPFGHDLKSARELNKIVHEVFDPDQVFRIDHYLGKETVQNILALRFANQMYEPIWNRSYVDHVQITMAEDIGIGGRAGYYDGIGSARDVIQNHLLQLMALTAMEEPAAFDAESLLTEKLKVLRAVKLPENLGEHTVRGQYAASWQGGERVRGYLQEDGIDPASTTDTYAAVKLQVDNRRWAGVPFYLRTGKRLGRRVTEIAVVFQRAPHSPFDSTATEELGANAIVIRVQPDEGMTVRFGSKVPGTSMEIRDVTMDFAYGESFTESSPEAYERLILDVLLGDANLFPRHQEVEESWKVLDPIEGYWDAHGKPAQYPSGSWGPKEADEMLARDGRSWRRP
ncbi:glucose-6-phosphate dehydrogenase [Streptomyces sp. NPDC060011]|uniref:glucose-6-phosphate dehydrogenase n=1 Tax=unclassified Streptomyces TaxID=2593676 RepID=UPI0013BA9DD3|nr:MULTISPECIES: glucose-6-phosphate dehydrogenase [unclassified Streptomyces]MCX4918069.1 glucose-6-phosphate dehydrogenase [Streptomyces sp. NBC_00687]MCX5135708.1 glucose-6-phosphate dehydrogenase [Streptomyces sp. NBC_00340]MCX5280161.1 glucose-6-phosphate dehydrogenase [Streptomyces sp. NBC_00198]NEB30412.1 glucose-6-phosphate dehydrogenase [Streptomyces sp. SID14446]WSK60152.1 glucose-6-phosphate dehydrogenase [Streptomyces sp. NBC_01281]